MSRIPLGKVLLRNVIRHTDAHNKIQEESEMWKIREWEKQTQDVHWGKQKRTLSNCSSSRMRSDGFDEESQHAEWKVKNLAPVSETMEDDLRHARYWNRKLYEYEANMPDSDQPDEQNSVNGKRKSQPGKQSSLELHKSKKAKKSHKKKRKKKSHKKRKKQKREQPNVASDSSQDTECSEEGVSRKKKRRRHKKAKKAAAAASAKPPASSSGPDSDSSRAGSCTSSSSEGSEPEEKPEKPPRKKRRRRHVSLSDRSGEGVQEKRSKRKNWKVAADEYSEDSSDED
ncbi:uncharacterized protein NKAPD1 isoform X3 [Hemicordylus capensis]|uniref:uncharacterized protein NKAPD1 isoform X3 n=1 Tax=Hemicordylus capensis TaxID=884348 RepID=UPI002304724C|nr:uncharacterized protein NKAPD1 isoform X3 [Hemicordylus capensis]